MGTELIKHSIKTRDESVQHCETQYVNSRESLHDKWNKRY